MENQTEKVFLAKDNDSNLDFVLTGDDSAKAVISNKDEEQFEVEIALVSYKRALALKKIAKNVSNLVSQELQE